MTSTNKDLALNLLSLGAAGVLSKPVLNSLNDAQPYFEELVRKVKEAATIRPHALARSCGYSPAEVIPEIIVNASKSDICNHIIAFGASTGGVEALTSLVPRLPVNSPPVVIVQHMPAGFTASFASRLNKLAKQKVIEASHLMPLSSGTTYIIPGGFHGRIILEGAHHLIELDEGPRVNNHRPSIDVLFESIAALYGANSSAALLTGMGSDGAIGLKHIAEAGGVTVTQSEESCVIYGMPGAAKKLYDHSVSELNDILEDLFEKLNISKS